MLACRNVVAWWKNLNKLNDLKHHSWLYHILDIWQKGSALITQGHSCSYPSHSWCRMCTCACVLKQTALAELTWRHGIIIMMMMLKLHKHSTHYLHLFHHHHPSCFLCDLLPNARHWLAPDLHNVICQLWTAITIVLSVSWDRKWHQWITHTCLAFGCCLVLKQVEYLCAEWQKERERESKSEEEIGKELLMGCCCVKNGTFQN